jgi:hypothetical protein
MHTYPKPIRIALWSAKAAVLLVPVFLLGWLLNRNFLLGGSVTYRYTPGTTDGPVVLGRPAELESIRGSDGRLRWRLTASALHFNAVTPRSVENVRVRMRVHTVNQPGVTFVAQGTPLLGEIKRVVYSKFLETLSWPAVQDGELILWQRVSQYPSVASFLDSPPVNSRVAVVGFPTDRFANVPDYQPVPSPIILPVPLRGSHSLLVYVGKEDLDLTFGKRDLNRVTGADSLTVRVLNPLGVQNFVVTIPDDGDTGSAGRLGPDQPVAVRIPGIGPGIVRISIGTTDDVLLTQFTTRQQYLAFERKVFLAQGTDNPLQPSFVPVSVSVKGVSVSVQTPQTAGLQTFTLGGKRYPLTEVKQSVTVPIPIGGGVLRLANGNAYIVTDGLLAVLPTRLVPEPSAVSLRADAVPDLSSVDFVLARYAPTPLHDVQTIDETYDARLLLRSNRRYYFVFEAPGLSDRDAEVEVEDIRVTFRPTPVHWTTITNAIQTAVRRFLGTP